VDIVAKERGLWCRAVSLTPIYDQLRGERINADLPASGSEPRPAQRRGSSGAAAEVAPLFGRPPGPRAQRGVDPRRVQPVEHPVRVD
jgi:hypothetical protein